MARLIDTSVLIEVERRGAPLDAVAALAPGEPIAIAAITASEVPAGVRRAVPSERRRRRETYVEEVIERIPTLPFDLSVARVHARVMVEMAAAGVLIGQYDLLIAATALASRSGVITVNVRDFERVPGLVVDRPHW